VRIHTCWTREGIEMSFLSGESVMGVKDRDGLVRGTINSLYLCDFVFGAICWALACQSYP